MKKFAFVLFGLFIGIVGTHLKHHNAIHPEQDELKEMNTQEQVATKESVPTKPKGLITPKEGKALSDNYTPRYAIVSKTLGMEDNRSVWFSIDELDSYLKYAKYETDEILKGDNKMNGIRVYLGAYPKDAKAEEPAGYTTVFLVPTYDASMSKGSMIPLQSDLESADVPGGSPLNMGIGGTPPQASYPQ